MHGMDMSIISSALCYAQLSIYFLENQLTATRLALIPDQIYDPCQTLTREKGAGGKVIL